LRSDPSLGFAFTIGLVTPIDDLAECGGTTTQFVSNIKDLGQRVSTPPGPNRTLDRVRGTIVLYDAVITSEEEFCALPESEIGRGQLVLMGNDNDVSVEGPGADSFGSRLNAILDLTSGGKAHLLIITRGLVLPDGSFAQRVERIELKPIGG